MSDLSHRIATRYLEAASEIEFEELPEAHQAFIKKIGYKIAQVWDGIHGVVVEFDIPDHKARLTKEFLHNLVTSSLFRWISTEDGRMSIGLTHS